MSLTQKFRDPCSGHAVSVSSLFRDTRYPVIHAKFLESRYRMRLVVALSEEEGNTVEVFLTKRYSEAVEYMDMVDINTR
jgi:hypothetical protein